MARAARRCTARRACGYPRRAATRRPIRRAAGMRIRSRRSCPWSSRRHAIAACAGSSPSCFTARIAWTSAPSNPWRRRCVRASRRTWRSAPMREALVFLAAAVVCVPVAARLGLGSVLGYLIAGAAIGPWGLGLAGDVTATQTLAELGVVLMLFVIGIELDPRRLAAMRREVFGYGSVQMAACGATLAVFLLALGLPWQAALIGGLALALSSTAIAVQAMTERNELRTPTGNTSF